MKRKARKQEKHKTDAWILPNWMDQKGEKLHITLCISPFSCSLLLSVYPSAFYSFFSFTLHIYSFSSNVYGAPVAPEAAIRI